MAPKQRRKTKRASPDELSAIIDLLRKAIRVLTARGSPVPVELSEALVQAEKLKVQARNLSPAFWRGFDRVLELLLTVAKSIHSMVHCLSSRAKTPHAYRVTD